MLSNERMRSPCGSPSLSWLAFHLNHVENRRRKSFFRALSTNSVAPNVQKPARPITVKPNQSIAFSAAVTSAKETILRSSRPLPYTTCIGLPRNCGSGKFRRFRPCGNFVHRTRYRAPVRPNRETRDDCSQCAFSSLLIWTAGRIIPSCLPGNEASRGIGDRMASAAKSVGRYP